MHQKAFASRKDDERWREMATHFSVQSRSLENFEELKRVVQSARTEITQVDRGRIQGNLSHLVIGDLPLDLGTFSLGVRSRGIVSEDRITIGMLTACNNRVTHWSHEMLPADVVVWPPGAEHDARYYGGASVAVISLDASDIDLIFGSEPRLRDFGVWTKSHYRPDPNAGADVIGNLHAIAAGLHASGIGLSAEAAEFWKRTIVDTIASTILENSPSDRDGPIPSALRIVKKVEDYINTTGQKPVHISEICNRLHVSRRTLHRAFHNAIGIGPVSFLCYKRLCSVNSALRSSDPATTTIGAVALQYGFINLGRFSGYYHSLFDEYPSQTLAARAD
ncbi:MAG TPA: helix-turn-helix domain-containing protein [Bradyrhizobium sp.]